MRAPPGHSALGCLVSFLLLGAAVYFATNVGQVYLRYYEYQDAMSTEARFAARNPNEVITSRLAAKADSLGLPAAAKKIQIRRYRNQIYIWADYTETVELPGIVRDIDFTPQVQRAF